MDAIALKQAHLAQLPASVAVPAYAREALVPSIVHIGVGGFYRAHQAVYLDDLLALPGQMQWAYCGVGLLAHDAAMRDAMQAQDGLYTVVERGAAGDSARVIGCVADYLYAPDDPQAVLEKLADAGTRIVSLTITEGGYYVNQGTGEFDAQHPDIVHELAHPQAPRCSFGYLAAALALRHQRGLPPLTLNVAQVGIVQRCKAGYHRAACQCQLDIQLGRTMLQGLKGTNGDVKLHTGFQVIEC